ncbi:hypothetical protein ETAA1_63390 [Urbifossiella limnaea]|uniref:Uncharacterized protein n=1 Tax=Urbifossiella limnaea TaxID=2528023 RepID=A0A517Y3G2_9BACT|nr:hypothetical protein ETAA1_63390 [Urbifossiella limnaea]
MRLLRFMLLALGATGLLISLPLLGFAALGYLGILADVGPDENRAIGIHALSLGLPAVICGVVLCVLGLRTVAWNRRRTDAAPGTSLE